MQKRGAAMSSDRSMGVRQGSQTGREGKPSPVGAKQHPSRRSRRGVPALLDWIEEAEAVNHTSAANILIAVLIVVVAVLTATRLGWLPP
jgi:hypothetical protein